MALHLIVGSKTNGPQSEVECLYCGRDADAAREARDSYRGASTVWVRNPEGVRKANAGMAQERDRVAMQADIAAQTPPPKLSARQLAARAQKQALAKLADENKALAAELKAMKAETQALLEESGSIDPDTEKKETPAEKSPEAKTEPATDKKEDAQTELLPADSDSKASTEDPEDKARLKSAQAAAKAAKEIEKNSAAKAAAPATTDADALRKKQDALVAAEKKASKK